MRNDFVLVRVRFLFSEFEREREMRIFERVEGVREF